MTDILQVQTTLPSREQANELARRLVEARLAACVQVCGPIASTYRWEGKLETAEEWLLLIKSTSAGYEALEREIIANHPYSVPEVLATAVTRGAWSYLDWVRSGG